MLDIKTFALVSLTATAFAAQAGTLVTGSPVSNAEIGDITVSGDTQEGDFAALPFSFEGGATISGYCIDPTQQIEANTVYTNYTQYTGAQYLTPVDNVNLAKLYSENNDLSTASAQAAFQIAVWELGTETSGTFNVGSGSTSFSGTDLAPAMALAQRWIDELASVTADYDLFVVQSPTNQDLIWGVPTPPVGPTPPVSAVPEPTSAALLLVGLIGVGAYARRRRDA